jgi:hypothetical protein
MSRSNAVPLVIAAFLLVLHLAAIWAACGRGATLAPGVWLCRAVCAGALLYAAAAVWRGRSVGIDGGAALAGVVELIALAVVIAARPAWAVWTVLVLHTLAAAAGTLFFALFRMDRLW